MQQTLNELYSKYISGELKRTKFEGLVYNYLVNNKEKTSIRHWKLDEYEDFLSWFYPRLRRAIDSYQEKGSSFEAFMARYLLISAKEYNVRKTTKSVIEYSAWSARIPEMYVYEESPVYLAVHKPQNNYAENKLLQLVTDKKGRKNKKRILALILKCYSYVSENFAEKIAPAIGIDSSELTEMLNRIRKLREEKDDKIYFLKERVHRQFYRCFIYEKRLSLALENSAAYKKLELQLEKARQRLEKMRKRMAIIRTEATNKQVAEIIGVTKGTVDSSLHKLKAKWETMSKKAALN